MKRFLTCTVAVIIVSLSSGATGLAAPPSVEGQDSQASPWDIELNPVDVDGWRIPIRHGQVIKPQFGMDHAAAKHKMQNVESVAAAVGAGKKDLSRGEQNPTYVVEVYNIDNPDEKLNLVVGAFTGNTIGKPPVPSPDGGPVGMLTAYCQGVVACPPWVNKGPDSAHGFGVDDTPISP